MFTLKSRLRFALGLGVLLFAVQAPGQLARVFLSGTGDDANDCSNAATPCRSLQGAVDQCPAKGEVIVLTSGGFGTATITKSLTINAPAGVVAFNARTIAVSIASGDKVVIRGMSMNGAAFGDLYGIDFSSAAGTLVVENSVIAGFQKGIYQNGASNRLIVHNCEFRNNSESGISSAGQDVTVEDSRFDDSRRGFELNAGKGVIRNSVATGNQIAGYIVGPPMSTTASLMIDHCVASGNGDGILAEQATAGTVEIRVNDSTITTNTYGLSYRLAGGVIYSYGRNRVWNNVSNGSFTGGVSEQ